MRTTSNKDGKRRLRTLIADVALLPETHPSQRGSDDAGTPSGWKVCR
jgi:hypothetical protein